MAELKSGAVNKRFYATVFGTRILNSVAGLVVAAIIISRYSEYDAGSLYALMSLVGFSFVVESGLPILVLQRASVLTRSDDWGALDSQARFDRVAPLLCHYLKLTVLIAAFVLGVLFPAGFLLPFEVSGGVAIWFWCCVAVAVVLPLSTTLNFLEGLGYLNQIATLRFTQAVVGQSVFILMLWFGQGVASVPAQLSAAVAVGIVGLWHGLSGIQLKAIGSRQCHKNGIDFFEVCRSDWSFQWRLWVNSLSGYFSNQAWVLGTSLTGNMALAAKVGVALQVVNAAVGFSITPLGSRIAQLTTLACSQSKLLYEALVKSLVAHSVVTGGVMVLCASIGYMLLLPALPNAHEKLFSYGPAFLLGLAIVFSAATAGVIVLNQSLGRDDLYKVSLTKVVVSFFCILSLRQSLGEWAFCIAYLFITSLVFFAALFLHKDSMQRAFNES